MDDFAELPVAVVLLGSALVLFPRILNCTMGFWQDGFEG
jgi:hypothetical protein